jgi:hypothetical protein
MTITLFVLRIVLILLLYGFLAMLAWLIWRELRRGATAPARAEATSVRGARLTVVAAGKSGYNEGRQFPLEAVTTLGRDLSNDIIVTDDYASSRHARIDRQEDGRFWLVDVGSRNGTQLNGRRILPNDPMPLDPGDVISIGGVELKVN